MASPPIKFIRKNDVEWIIELWLAINGGDPAPDRIATVPDRAVSQAAHQMIRALSVKLDPAHAKAVHAALGH